MTLSLLKVHGLPEFGSIVLRVAAVLFMYYFTLFAHVLNVLLWVH